VVVNEDEVGLTCSTHGESEKFTHYLVGTY